MEFSLPWGGIVIGDAGPYTDDNWSDVWRKLFTVDRATQGVLRNYGGMLAVTGIVSPVSVAAGAAVVDGKWYETDAALNVVVPTPAALTRIDRIVVRKDFANQTARVTRIAGIEGGAAPALVQIDGVTWDIPLAQASITIVAAITLTDQRVFIRGGISQVTDRGVVINLNGGGALVQTGVQFAIPIPRRMSLHLTGWEMASPKQAATSRIDLWYTAAPGGGMPTNANSITNGAEPNLAAAQYASRDEAGLRTDGWSLDLAGGGFILGNVDNNNLSQLLALTLEWETRG
jgi:hypothetical protein